MGRPPEFSDRVCFLVYFERTELAAIRRCATRAGLTVSRFIRRAAVATARRKE